MDVIWLLAEQGTPAADALDAILQQMERDFRAAKTLYEHLLPTVGDTIAPALFRRLRAVRQPEAQASDIVGALGKLGAAAVTPGAIGLLSNEDGQLRRNAMSLLALRPAAEALETLWPRYVDLLRKSAEEDSPADGQGEAENRKDVLWERLSLWPALKACVPLNPLWLERTIQAGNPALGEPAGALAALLCEVPDGRERWLRVKETLRQSVAGGGERHYASAAYHWRDGSEVEWLRVRTGNPNGAVGACCLRALVRIAPAAALAALGDLPPRELSSTRKWTVNLLWARRPLETPARVRGLMQERPHALWDYAQTLHDLPNAMDADTLNLFLDALYPRMAQETVIDLRSEMGHLEDVNRLPLLRCLQQRAGTPWEERLVRLLIGNDPHPKGWRNVFQKKAAQVLYKIGGEGYTKLVNHWLANGDAQARWEGIDAAFKRPNAETVRLLEGLAAGGQDGEREDGSDYASRIAQLALARTGAWRAVIGTFVVWQGNSNREIIFARWGAGPLPDEEMEPAFAALRENPKHPGAIMALGFGQRTDQTGFIVSTLAGEDPRLYTDVVNACLWALTMQPHVPQEAVDVLAARLAQQEGRWLVVPLLVKEGGDRAARALLEFLRARFETPLSGPYSTSVADDAMAAARFLIQNPATADEATALCREKITRDAEPDFIAQRLIETLMDDTDKSKIPYDLLSDERTHGFFTRNAFNEAGSIHFGGERVRAIRGLSAFSPTEAYEAALRVIKNPHANDRDRAPDLLLELDHDRAVGDLLSHLEVERKTLLRRTCARALRAAEDELREHHLTSPSPRRREAACFALGFATPSDANLSAVRLCLEDEDVRVFEAACGALRQLEAARCTDELATAYITAEGSAQRWILLDAALGVGDPFEVGWLERMLQDAPTLTVEYVRDQVGKRRKTEEQEADTEDRHNHVG